MQSKDTDIETYLKELPPERAASFNQLRDTICNNLPKGFKEVMSYGMIGYVVPHEIFPAGYHVNPKIPLPFVNIASQKNFIALHHMGLYGSKKLLDWFVGEYPKHSKTKLDMGKACVRFKKPEHIPFELIGELMRKVSVEEYVSNYLQLLKGSKK